MTRGSIREYAMAVRPRYVAAGRREKGVILQEFCTTTGYHRKAAIRLLRHPPPPARASKRGRRPTYGPEVAQALHGLWEAADRICSKRLAPFLPELVAHLERLGVLALPPEVRAQLLQLSSSSIDRLLQPFRRQARRRPWSQSRSPSALKALVPVRTFGEWANVQPGSCQADLVAHCGESAAGFFLHSLVMVDVKTTWAEFQAVWGKGQQRVSAGVHLGRRHLPFPLQELHTDNGGEFVNHVLYPYCQREGIRLTRGRPYRKNDQAHVEQRNGSVVRRLVGYDRYSSKAAYAQLQQVYDLLRLYTNFFQPVQKLVRKQRLGAKVIKRYDRAQTPYQRLLEAGVLGETEQQALQRQYHSLNPLQLRAQLEAALEALWRLADPPGSLRTPQGPPEEADLGDPSLPGLGNNRVTAHSDAITSLR